MDLQTERAWLSFDLSLVVCAFDDSPRSGNGGPCFAFVLLAQFKKFSDESCDAYLVIVEAICSI